jgi:hypothetical protein
MSARVSKICLTVYGVLLVLSFFLLSVPGDYWLWYAVMVPFAAVPLCFGQRWYRLAGGIALLLAALLTVGDIAAGKVFRQRMQRMRAASAEKKGEPDGAANGSQPIRSETNRTSSAAGSRR